MKINIVNSYTNRDIAVIGFFEEDKPALREISDAIKKKMFSKKFKETYYTNIRNRRTLFVGLGKKKEFSIERYRRILGKVVNYVKSLKLQKIFTDIPSCCSFNERLLGRATAEALILSNYAFDKYLSKDKKSKPILAVSLKYKSSQKYTGGLKEGRIIAESTNLTRDLVNESANVANSVYLENMARKIAKESSKISVKVLNEPQLKKLGMNALLAVNAGSNNPPKLVIMEYKGSSDKPVALVGKGITFDSGGYNLKPTKYIEDMKDDMSGAAAVMGLIKTASKLGIKKNIVGVMALCENMVSATAFRPGDIVKAYNGLTIEIGNTDAEGRLILADALSYTEKQYKPSLIIDLATLTGACMVAFGYYTCGAVGNDNQLLDELKIAGLSSGDRAWPLPFFEEYYDWMDGTISDLNNMAQKGKGYEGGAITASVFLSKFIQRTKWVHLDLSNAYPPLDTDYLKKGASGAGVRLLSYYLLGE